MDFEIEEPKALFNDIFFSYFVDSIVIEDMEFTEVPAADDMEVVEASEEEETETNKKLVEL